MRRPHRLPPQHRVESLRRRRRAAGRRRRRAAAEPGAVDGVEEGRRWQAQRPAPRREHLPDLRAPPPRRRRFQFFFRESVFFCLGPARAVANLRGSLRAFWSLLERFEGAL